MTVVVERPPLGYLALLGLVAALAAFVVLGFAGVLPVDQLFVLATSFILAQAIAVILAFIGGLMVGLFLAHRILGSRDFTPFERAVLEGQEEIRALLRRSVGGRAEPGDPGERGATGEAGERRERADVAEDDEADGAGEGPPLEPKQRAG